MRQLAIGDDVFGCLPYGPFNKRGAFAESVTEQVRALEHSGGGFNGRRVERDDPVTRLVLAAPDVQEAFDEIDVTPAQVLDLDRPHRRVGRDDGGAVDMLPFRIGRS